MLKKGLENKANKYFVLVSGSCIPLYNFEDMYSNIFSSKKSRIQFEEKNYGYKYYYGHKWLILNRKCAKLLSEISYEQIYDEYLTINNHCPDELYPMLWFIKKLGPISSKKFKDQIDNKMVTYTKWARGASSPMRLKLKDITKSDLCSTDALLARKFYKNSADKFAMSCSDKVSEIRSTKRFKNLKSRRSRN